jgi:hypothetical protein
MTLAIGWPHDAGEKPPGWTHEGGDWQPGGDALEPDFLTSRIPSKELTVHGGSRNDAV